MLLYQSQINQLGLDLPESSIIERSPGFVIIDPDYVEDPRLDQISQTSLKKLVFKEGRLSLDVEAFNNDRRYCITPYNSGFRGSVWYKNRLVLIVDHPEKQKVINALNQYNRSLK